MTVELIGIGTASPPFIATQDEALALARRLHRYDGEVDRVLHALYRRSGVSSRRVVLDPGTGAPLRSADSKDGSPTTAERMRMFEALAPPLAVQAARKALEAARLAPERVTHLVTVSCTGASAPGIDVELIERLQLPRTTARAHIGFMGCYGALAGLRVAQAFANDEEAVVLLAAVELCSLHFHYGEDPEQIVANALFADGAGAAVLERSSNPARGRSLRAVGSLLFPDSADLMSWKIGDHGFSMSLSPLVPQRIEQHLRPWLEEWLGRQGTTLASIENFVIHPGGPRILSAVETSLALAPSHLELSRAVLKEYGNMSSPTVLFILERQLALGRTGKTLALGFGPGLVAEAALFE
jgi:predicted naringenin-chalcone synthase